MSNNIIEVKVVDNKLISMVDAFSQILPLGEKLSIAVGYFFLSGYELIREDFNQIAINGGVRIIIGNKTDRSTSNEIHEGMTAYTKSHLEPSFEGLSPQAAISEELIALASEEGRSESAWQLRDLIKYGKLKIRVF